MRSHDFLKLGEIFAIGLGAGLFEEHHPDNQTRGSKAAQPFRQEAGALNLEEPRPQCVNIGSKYARFRSS